MQLNLFHPATFNVSRPFKETVNLCKPHHGLKAAFHVEFLFALAQIHIFHHFHYTVHDHIAENHPESA